MRTKNGRAFEFTRPNADFQVSRAALGREVYIRIRRKRSSQASAYHSFRQVRAANPASRNCAIIAIPIAVLADDDLPLDKVGEMLRSGRAARPWLSGTNAGLVAFGRIDAREPDPQTGNIQSVPVDAACGSGIGLR